MRRKRTNDGGGRLATDIGRQHSPRRAVLAERMRVYALATYALFKAQLRHRRDTGQGSADGAVDFAGIFVCGGVDGDNPLPRMARQPRDACMTRGTKGTHGTPILI